MSFLRKKRHIVKYLVGTIVNGFQKYFAWRLIDQQALLHVFDDMASIDHHFIFIMYVYCKFRVILTESTFKTRTI